MGRFYRVQVALERDSLLSRDVITNTWHMEYTEEPSAGSTEWPNALLPLQTWYGSISNRLSSELTGNGRMKMYDLEHEETRVPVLIDDFTFTPGTTATPAEIAIALSLATTLGSGDNPRRGKGRVFIGPCNQASFAVETGLCRVTVATHNAYLNALETMYDSLNSNDWRLSIFSKTAYLASGSYADAFQSVDTAWVDDAPDVIRSRGFRTQARTTKVLNP